MRTVGLQIPEKEKNEPKKGEDKKQETNEKKKE